MGKNDNTILIVGLAVAAAYVLSKKDSNSQDAEPVSVNMSPTSLSPAASTQTQVVIVNGYPIIYGKYSPDAKQIQAALGVNQDGVIGSGTLAAWQKVVPAITTRFKISNASQLKDAVDTIKAASFWRL